MKLDLTRRGFLGSSVLATAAASLLPKHARALEPAAGLDVACTVNGQAQALTVGEDESAAHVLRERLGLTGTKIACGHGACGACTVLVDGTPHVTCLLPAAALAGKAVTTVEGLSPDLHPVQRAFMGEDALQCGYCTPGFVVEAAAFHDKWRAEHSTSEPTRDDVAKALAGHLCRCGAYNTIYAAVQAACAGKYDAGEVHPDRVDALDKVTGKAVYTVDVRLEGQLEGRVYRSPHAHARLKRFDDSAARALPGVKAVHRILADGALARYAGQEVAALAAVDAETAEEALHALDVEWDVLPSLVGTEQSLASGAPEVYAGRRGRVPSNSEGPMLPAGWEGNVRGPSSSSIFAHPGKARRAVKEAPVVVTDTYDTQNQCHTTLEPHATVARWLPDGSLEAWVSTQNCSGVREDLVQHFDLKHDQVRVFVPFVGGAFGAKAVLQPDTVIAVELARQAGAPVRVALPRTEELISGGYRPGARLEVSVATDEAGAEMLGVQVKSWSDGGVSVGSSNCGPLRFVYPNAPKSLEDWDVVSHGPPGKPLRAPGGVQGYFALEQAVDELCIKLGKGPIEGRRPWMPNPIRQRLFDWLESQPAYAQRGPTAADTGRYRRGIGVAVAGWVCIVQPTAHAQLDTGPDGLVLSSGSQDIGNGTRSMLAAALSREFGMRPDEVAIKLGDSNLVYGPMSAGSRTTASLAPIVADIAAELKEHLVESVSEQMGLIGAWADTGGIQHDGGVVTWREAIAVAPPATFTGRRRRDKAGWAFPVTVADTNAIKAASVSVQMVQVEVDARLGRVKALETWTGIGVGHILAPRLARSQIEGAMVQSIGFTLYEERRLDPTTGWILTGGLEDYRLCGIGDAPVMNVHFDEGGYEDVRGQRVGLGELPMLAVAPALANAVFHATGFRPKSLPIRLDRVVGRFA